VGMLESAMQFLAGADFPRLTDAEMAEALKALERADAVEAVVLFPKTQPFAAGPSYMNEMIDFHGSPVAVLDIPAIGIRDMVVVQGTSPENMMLGPGHLRVTPMPGQAGVSEIFGRRATFGAPFARLGELRPGDVIVTVTGQGRSVYRVAAVGSSQAVRIVDPAPNRLLLVTAASPVVPSYYIEIDARLVSVTRPGPPVVRVLNAPELALAGDDGALVLTFIWGIALAAVSALGTYGALRWNLWAAYLAAVPLAIAVLWCLYQSLAALLPNLY